MKPRKWKGLVVGHIASEQQNWGYISVRTLCHLSKKTAFSLKSLNKFREEFSGLQYWGNCMHAPKTVLSSQGHITQYGSTTNGPYTLILPLMLSTSVWDLRKTLHTVREEILHYDYKKQNVKVIIFNNIKNKMKTNKGKKERSSCKYAEFLILMKEN